MIQTKMKHCIYASRNIENSLLYVLLIFFKINVHKSYFKENCKSGALQNLGIFNKICLCKHCSPFWQFIGILWDQSWGICIDRSWSRAPSIPRNKTDDDLTPDIVAVISSVSLEVQALDWNRNLRLRRLSVFGSVHAHRQGVSLPWPIPGNLHLGAVVGSHTLRDPPTTKKAELSATADFFFHMKIFWHTFFSLQIRAGPEALLHKQIYSIEYSAVHTQLINIFIPKIRLLCETEWPMYLNKLHCRGPQYQQVKTKMSL